MIGGNNMATAKESFEEFASLWGTYIKDIETVNSIILMYEEKTNIELSPGAKQVLFIPIIEYLEIGGLIDEKQLDETISIIFASLETNPDDRDLKLGDRIRSTFSVIRAFWKKFCKIPPICS